MTIPKFILSRFSSERQFRVFTMLLLASTACLLLVLGRLYMNRNFLPRIDSFSDFVWARGMTYAFLIWNLFLAWVPYLASLRVERLHRLGAGKVFILGWMLLWLLFLPNAPYIITDFIHFRPLEPVPVWYDLMLLFSASCTGLLLGLVSMFEIHQVLKAWFSKSTAASLLLSFIALAGFGVWLGRFKRWNSWDAFTRPQDLLLDIAQTLNHPHGLTQMLGISVLLAGILLVGYGFLLALTPKDQH